PATCTHSPTPRLPPAIARPSSASYGTLKELSGGGGGGGTALLNKENKFWDRSFIENGERSQHLLHLQQQQKGGGGSQINSTRYKTELCRLFEESGNCKYGEKCQFAQGFHELRSLTRHPKYKTELCRTFHTIGFCHYGPRCHFIHNADERRPAPSGGHLRGLLHHSLSFSGFPSGHHQPPGGLESALLLDSPRSRTPPPPSCSSASSLITPLAIQTHNFTAVVAAASYRSQQQQQQGLLLRRLSESPVFGAPPSPPDSLSDRDSYLSGSLSFGNLSGSESPGLDPGRRLPIFSRLSISEDRGKRAPVRRRKGRPFWGCWRAPLLRGRGAQECGG
ncbi:hypothetical protein FD755_024324, partial [Muntiacus reevesi]